MSRLVKLSLIIINNKEEINKASAEKRKNKTEGRSKNVCVLIIGTSLKSAEALSITTIVFVEVPRFSNPLRLFTSKRLTTAAAQEGFIYYIISDVETRLSKKCIVVTKIRGAFLSLCHTITVT